MTALVLYRKWRPDKLEDVVGQDVVVRILRQAVIQERIAHAYLLCGPRGTGKTTLARIISRAVNCASPQDGEPCDLCASCKTISQGQSIDLVEIDGASNRGIDDMRSLRERAHYAPAQNRYKVYIIDEVHMLTEPAFNALLKTLEEPPPATIFVLATTAIHKVLPTIVSRCQRLDLKRISAAAIAARLRHICLNEGISSSDEALIAIARTAFGSLRDAINLLEQATVSYGLTWGLSELQELLGIGDQERALELAEEILTGDTQQGLGVISSVFREGLDLREFHRQTLDYLRWALLLHSGAEELLDCTQEVLKRLKSATSSSSTKHLVESIKLFSQVNIRQDISPALSLELALIESAFIAESILPQDAEANKNSVLHATANEITPVAVEAALPITSEATPVAVEAALPITSEAAITMPNPAEGKSVNIESSDQVLPTGIVRETPLESRFPELVTALQRRKGKRFFLGALLRDCRNVTISDGILQLRFNSRSNLERMESELASPEGWGILQEGIQQVLGTPLEVQLALVGGDIDNTSSEEGHLVRFAMAKGGRIIEEEG